MKSAALVTNLPPLAERMRPRNLAEVIGQEKIIGEGSALRIALESGRVHSMILWGPPGCGKTTLARLASQYSGADFIALSAVLAGIADVREAVKRAEANLSLKRQTILFIDEVHRFNKAQQDAFLPHVESGLLTLIGATTENPSFAVNSALLSRVRVYVLQAPNAAQIGQAIRSALADSQRGLAGRLQLDEDAIAFIASAADGDVRRALTALDVLVDIAPSGPLDQERVASLLQIQPRRFDKGGDQFYEQISALHKTLRNSNPDAALYWFCRMLDGGCDPHYIARRLLRFASEDIGNADPRALSLALTAWQSYERLGSPEGDLVLAQLVLYLAVAAKSNAGYVAFKAATADAIALGSADVPVHLRNAPTNFMKNLGYGADYRYAHDEVDGVAYAETGFPAGISEREYYFPVERGLEIKIKEKLDWLRSKRHAAQGGRS
jgi:putative ATPase